jgi:hypothetical protein
MILPFSASQMARIISVNHWHLVPTLFEPCNNLRGRKKNYNPHFTKEKTEAQRGHTTEEDSTGAHLTPVRFPCCGPTGDRRRWQDIFVEGLDPSK